jgi:hypothetical protein
MNNWTNLSEKEPRALICPPIRFERNHAILIKGTFDDVGENNND